MLSVDYHSIVTSSRDTDIFQESLRVVVISKREVAEESNPPLHPLPPNPKVSRLWVSLSLTCPIVSGGGMAKLRGTPQKGREKEIRRRGVHYQPLTDVHLFLFGLTI